MDVFCAGMEVGTKNQDARAKSQEMYDLRFVIYEVSDRGEEQPVQILEDCFRVLEFVSES